MAMSVTRDNTRAFTVSADHLIGAYDLMVSLDIFHVRRLLAYSSLHRTMKTHKLVVRYTALNIPVMLQWLSETTEGYVLSAVGMESTC